MNNLEIFERLIAALKRAAFLPNNTMEIDEYKKCIETMSDSGELDSLLFVTALVEIEKEFDIEISDDYLMANIFSSVDNLVDLIDMLIKKKGNTDN